MFFDAVIHGSGFNFDFQCLLLVYINTVYLYIRALPSKSLLNTLIGYLSYLLMHNYLPNGWLNRRVITSKFLWIRNLFISHPLFQLVSQAVVKVSARLQSP